MAKFYMVILPALFAGFVVGGLLQLGPLPPTKPTRNYTEEMFPFPSCNMILTAEQIRSGIVGERYRWRNGLFVHPDRRFLFSFKAEYNVINDAMYELFQILCIPVLIWPQNSFSTGDYVEIVKGAVGSGCTSYIGKRGGRQLLNLEPACVHKYVVLHEAIHALGYYHEQSRADRDNYVNILWGNIKPGLEYAFNIEAGTTTFNVPYDLASIMQYASTSFSANGQPTITRKDGTLIPTNTLITPNDIQKLHGMYNC